LDYTVSGNQITLNFSTLLEDKLYVVYFK